MTIEDDWLRQIDSIPLKSCNMSLLPPWLSATVTYS